MKRYIRGKCPKCKGVWIIGQTKIYTISAKNEYEIYDVPCGECMTVSEGRKNLNKPERCL